MHTIGCSWSHEKCGKGCVCAYGTVCHVCTSEGGLQCNASVSGLSLLGGLYWLSIRQSMCVLWSSMTTCGLPKDSALSLMSASPSSTEASESRGKHDQMHRVGPGRWLRLLRPTHRHTTQSQHPHTSLYKFCGHCEDGAARSHISTWVGVVYCSFSAAHFKFRSESGNGTTTPCGAVTGFTFVARIP